MPDLRFHHRLLLIPLFRFTQTSPDLRLPR